MEDIKRSNDEMMRVLILEGMGNKNNDARPGSRSLMESSIAPCMISIGEQRSRQAVGHPSIGVR